MAIDRNVTININDISPSANTAYVDAGKENKVYNKSQVNELIEDLREGTLGSILPSQTLPQLNTLPDGNYYAAEAGTYAFGVTVPNGWQYRFSKIGNVWDVLTKVEMPMQDLNTVVAKSDLKSSELIDYNSYVLSGYTYNSAGDKIASANSKIIENLPVDPSKLNLYIDNIIPDTLKKIFYKNASGVITGGVGDLSVIPKVSSIPSTAVTMSCCFSRNSQPELPTIKYGNTASDNIYAIEDKKLTAQKLSTDNEVPAPTAPKMAVNKEYFDANALSENSITSEEVFSDNKLNRDYIVTGKYINSAGEVLNSAQQHIIQNHPISEYAGQLVTFNGFIPSSTKKLVFRDNSNVIIGSIFSLTTAPFTVLAPELATKYDLSAKGATDAISSYDELRMNVGPTSLPYKPFKETLITEILGKGIYAEKAKGAESGGGNLFDQSLNKADNVEFNSVTTQQLIYSAIQFNLPTGAGAPPIEVQIGDAWVDTSNGNTIKVKTS